MYRVELPPNAHRYDHRCGCPYCTNYEKSLQASTWGNEKQYRTLVYTDKLPIEKRDNP